MRSSFLTYRSLQHYGRSHLWTVLGIAAATAALTGSLIVGESVRGSLRSLALERLCGFEHALQGQRFVGQERAASLQESLAASRVTQADGPLRVLPLIRLDGTAANPQTKTRAGQVTIIGSGDDSPLVPDLAPNAVILNQPLARELAVEPGGEVLLRLARPTEHSPESLLGRKDDAVATLRLSVHAIIPADGAGAFSLAPAQQTPLLAYVNLVTLQRALRRSEQINTLAVVGADIDRLNTAWRALLSPSDFGLSFRHDPNRPLVALESDRFLLEPPIESAALAAAAELGVPVQRVLTYLANTITLEGRDPPRILPYSTVAALDHPEFLTEPGEPHLLNPGEILLNDWAAEDLDASPGDRLVLTYYLTDAFGQILTTQHSFTLRGVLPLTGNVADPSLTPHYPGLTDTKRIADWDPPFPVDLKLIRDQDERYWERYRATPKAFIHLGDGQSLWAQHAERFGRLTSIRLLLGDPADLQSISGDLERTLRKHLDPAAFGLTFQPVRDQALTAAAGTTDFASLFVAFSSFLIASAAILVALFFRLAVERRARQIGLLLAVGFTPQRVRNLLLGEGLILAAIGAAVGTVLAVGYGALMLTGLRTWWSAAAHAPFLQLHLDPATLAVGALAGILVCVVAITLSLRGLTRAPVPTLLAGAVTSPSNIAPPPTRRLTPAVAVLALLVAIALPFLVGKRDVRSATPVFFASGVAALFACLLGARIYLRAPRRRTLSVPARAPLIQLAFRNLTRHPTRSLATMTMIAAATFLLTSLQSFRLGVDPEASAHPSPIHRFPLYAESAVPILFDLNTPAGRDALNLSASAIDAVADSRVYPFRLRPGDAAGCTNLYQKSHPTILGASPRMIERGGLQFASALATADAPTVNPWTLLDHVFPDGAIPVLGDLNTVTWQLHRGLGDDFTITDERGQSVTLRFVALLKNSPLQDELVVAESAFTRLFPSLSGYRFFLIETPPGRETAVQQALESELENYGFDATPTRDRLARYFAVQNTYLATFQTLGGLGLLLGTLGVAALQLRHVWERRAELALLTAVGYTPSHLARLVLAENAALLLAGALAGWLPALIAIAPHADDGTWRTLPITPLAVVTVGMLAAAAALLAASRHPLLPALRSE